MSVRKGRDRTLLYSHSDDTATVLDALGLTLSDLFDTDRVSYSYPDGRVVTRTPEKKFSQSGNRTGAALYGADKLPDDNSVPVYVVEGEQDVDTLATVGAVAVSAAMGATNPDKADWSPLANRPVIAVVDRDTAGDGWAAKLRVALADVASSTVFVRALVGKDATDHIAAGNSVDDFEPMPISRAVGVRRLKPVRASEVKMTAIRWWWPGLAPYSALTLLAGPGDTGKSTVAAAWVGLETQNGGTVVYLHSEEGRQSQLTPKLKAAGADLDKVFFLDVGVTLSDGTEADTKLRLPGDLPLLVDFLDEVGASFIVFDALTSFKPEGSNGNSQDDVREFLEPIARLAADRDAVILGIAHLGKDESRDARKAVLGSTAWTDVPRSVLAFARDPDTGWGVISDVKGNLSAKKHNLEYTIESSFVTLDDGVVTEVGRAVFGNDTDRTADDLRFEIRQRRDNPDTDGDGPGDWLGRFLKNGPQPAANAYIVGGQAGFSKDQLKRALRKIGDSAKARGTFSAGWWWRQAGQVWPWEESTEESETPSYTKNRSLLLLPRSDEGSTAPFEERTAPLPVSCEDCEGSEGSTCKPDLPHDCPLPDEPVGYWPTMLGDEEDAS